MKRPSDPGSLLVGLLAILLFVGAVAIPAVLGGPAGSEAPVATTPDATREPGDHAPGRPPWAGGWKVVGRDHPGWSQEKWDRWQAKVADKAKQHGVECWPPGHCMDKDKVKPTAAP
jgi:hypothetical protein